MEKTTPTTPFRQSQFGWWILLLTPLALIPMIVAILTPEEKIPLAALIIIPALPVLIVLLFYKMTVTVDTERITITYGIGLIRKRIPLTRIRDSRIVTASGWYGYGIRLIPNGWMYNISGNQAVELLFHDTSRILWIGSPDNIQLRAAIKDRTTAKA